MKIWTMLSCRSKRIVPHSHSNSSHSSKGSKHMHNMISCWRRNNTKRNIYKHVDILSAACSRADVLHMLLDGARESCQTTAYQIRNSVIWRQCHPLRGRTMWQRSSGRCHWLSRISPLGGRNIPSKQPQALFLRKEWCRATLWAREWCQF